MSNAIKLNLLLKNKTLPKKGQGQFS